MFRPLLVVAQIQFGDLVTGWGVYSGLFILLALVAIVWLLVWVSLRYIPHHQVGVVEKIWSSQGSVKEGRILALNGEAGYQPELLRGGIHLGYWRWQYRIHRAPLVTVAEGRIGYVYARDGEPLPPDQTLGRIVECNQFQDARAFLAGEETAPADEFIPGQRGRQRAILREGVYAINPALFVVITEERLYSLRARHQNHEWDAIRSWQTALGEMDGFRPIVIGKIRDIPDPIHPERLLAVDDIGIITVHDGPPLAPGEIIAPVPTGFDDHSNYQNPEAFLQAGGRRGRQYLPLTDGTYFINRWFATVELVPKTVIPIGYVGVVISFHGRVGNDVSGASFRHGERVSEGERGVWERPFGPGKYPFNTYAGTMILVPTTNFVLHWVTGKSEAHRYDESLRSIDLVTKDAYEPRLPLSVVVHIDYAKAPNVIQRFGDVQKLITQTLDPMLSAYFRDVAHKRTMLELLHERDDIQLEARRELRRKFQDFDIECIDVLIGKPDTEEGGKIETLLDQLRIRQLATEQIETYGRQCAAADKLRILNEAQAQAAKQADLTNARLQIQVADSQGEADLARAKKQAEQTVVQADANLAKSRREAEQTVLVAEANSRKHLLEGRGEGQRQLQVGLAQATVLLRKVQSLGDPRLFALSLICRRLAQSAQPLVPERVFLSNSTGDDGSGAQGSLGLLGTLIQLLVAEKSGFQPMESASSASLNEMADKLSREALQQMESQGGDQPPHSAA